jgi:uroporphyrin-III C-methyltransferase
MDNQITPENDNTDDSHHTVPWKNIGIGLCSFAIILLIVVFYVGMCRIISINKKLAAVTAELNSTQTQNTSDIAALQKTVTDNQQNIGQWHDDFVAEQATIEDLKKSFLSKSDEWSVAEAQYLVKNANANLELGDNISLVIRLLQSASQELQKSDQPQIVTIRKALAQDILNLQAVPELKTTDTFLTLTALNSQVDKMPLTLPRSPTASNDDAAVKKEKWWQRGWQASLKSLQKIVVVRYSEPGVRPFILPDQQEFLFQNIHAMLYQAMTALIHKQPEIYRTSLDQAIVWIQKYFQADSSITQAELDDLKKLQNINLRPTLPTLTSLQAFHDYDQQTAVATPK